MLNDENLINDINPFQIEGPGAWRKPYGFAPAAADKDKITCDSYGCSIAKQSGDQWEPELENPECDWGITAQTNGSLDAPSCRKPMNPISCPMGRALEPTQEFIPDLYTLIPYRDPVPKALTQSQFPIIAIAIIIVLLMIVKR